MPHNQAILYLYRIRVMDKRNFIFRDAFFGELLFQIILPPAAIVYPLISSEYNLCQILGIYVRIQTTLLLTRLEISFNLDSYSFPKRNRGCDLNRELKNRSLYGLEGAVRIAFSFKPALVALGFLAIAFSRLQWHQQVVAVRLPPVGPPYSEPPSPGWDWL